MVSRVDRKLLAMQMVEEVVEEVVTRGLNIRNIRYKARDTHPYPCAFYEPYFPSPPWREKRVTNRLELECMAKSTKLVTPWVM